MWCPTITNNGKEKSQWPALKTYSFQGWDCSYLTCEFQNSFNANQVWVILQRCSEVSAVTGTPLHTEKKGPFKHRDCVMDLQMGNSQLNVKWSLFKILGTGMSQKTNLFYRQVGPCPKHPQGPHWEVTVPNVRPGPSLGAVIITASSYVIMWIILSPEKGLHGNTTFYLAVISGTAKLTCWSEI